MTDDVKAEIASIRAAVEGATRKVWVDYLCAAILSLTTIASAWCAYQSARWSGVQAFRLAEANKASRDAMALERHAQTVKTFDAQMFVAFAEAKFRGDEKYSEFLRTRFRPEARGAVEAWLKLEPLTNEGAAKHPFELPEYREPQREKAAESNAESARFTGRAADANQSSDRYTLLTVMFATVLFFGGISGTLHSRNLRATLLILGAILFLGTLISLSTLPYCNE